MKKHLLLNIIVIITFFYGAAGAISKKNLSYVINSHNVINLLQQDTNKYLHDEIIAHKERFQHKELNVLLAELNLKPQSYLVIRGEKPGDPYKSLRLYFEGEPTTSKKIHNLVPVPFLTIYFENGIPAGKALVLYGKTYGVWGANEDDFYGKMIIQDIEGLKPRKK